MEEYKRKLGIKPKGSDDEEDEMLGNPFGMFGMMGFPPMMPMMNGGMNYQGMYNPNEGVSPV